MQLNLQYICVQVCVIKSSTLEKERLTYCPFSKSGKFQLLRTVGSTLTLGIIVPFFEGMIYLLAWAIVYSLAVGISRTSRRLYSIVPTLFPFNNRLLQGNSWQMFYRLCIVFQNRNETILWNIALV